MIFLVRLDDCHSKQEFEKWERMLSLLKKHSVRPLVGIIPYCQDETISYPVTVDFDSWLFERLSSIVPGVHGKNHVFHDSPLPLYKGRASSEFVGLSVDEQIGKLKDSLSWFSQRNINPKWFVAPRHSFDKETIKACGELNLSISDGIELWPYIEKASGVLLVPQIFNKARKPVIDGCYTFCYHPNNMKDSEFLELENFLQLNSKFFGTWDLMDKNMAKGSFKKSIIYNKLLISVRNVWNLFFKRS